MCNNLQNEYEPIPESGTGYKLFTKSCYNFLTLCGEMSSYKGENGQPIDITKEFAIWNDNYHTEANKMASFDPNLTEPFGFCFFTDWATAKFAIDKWPQFARSGEPKVCICRIEYRKGIGEHIETRMLIRDWIKVALCKEFRIIEEDSQKRRK